MTDQQTYTYDFQRPVAFVPRRVVSLVPSITESLFDLSMGDRVIGVTEYCTRPVAQTELLPKVGGTKNPDIARIIALNPDLVMLNSEENRKEDADALTTAGIATWTTQPNTVREALDLLWQMMDVFEQPVMVPRVRLIEITYEWVSGIAATITPRRVFVPIWRDPWMTFNRDTFIHDLLRVCGAENVFADRVRHYPLKADLGQMDALPPDDPRVVGQDVRYPRITLDEVIAAQPDMILLPDEPKLFTEADVRELSKLDIPAARTGAIHLVDGSLLSWHGTRLAYALRDLPPLFGVDATS